MKLVFVTQVIDGGDAVLGFVTRWVQGLAGRCERVRVLALEVGDVGALPANVDVRCIGRKGTLRRWLRYRRFLGEALGRDGFDTILTHMVPRYSSVAAGPARRHGARHFLWYTHKGVDDRLRRAVEVVDGVFTASAESMRIETEKRIVTGHGIDVGHFAADGVLPSEPPRLLSVGRLTPSKDPLTIIEALERLVEGGRDLYLDWAGSGLVEADREFEAQVRRAIAERGLGERVVLHGAVPYTAVPGLFARSTVFVSASRTGSVDKVVLEAMAAGRLVVTSNESFPPIFAELGERAASLAFEAGNAEELAQRVAALLDLDFDERAAFGRDLRAIVVRDHEVDALMGRLVSRMEGVG